MKLTPKLPRLCRFLQTLPASVFTNFPTFQGPSKPCSGKYCRLVSSLSTSNGLAPSPWQGLLSLPLWPGPAARFLRFCCFTYGTAIRALIPITLSTFSFTAGERMVQGAVCLQSVYWWCSLDARCSLSAVSLVTVQLGCKVQFVYSQSTDGAAYSQVCWTLVLYVTHPLKADTPSVLQSRSPTTCGMGLNTSFTDSTDRQPCGRWASDATLTHSFQRLQMNHTFHQNWNMHAHTCMYVCTCEVHTHTLTHTHAQMHCIRINRLLA